MDILSIVLFYQIDYGVRITREPTGKIVEEGSI